MEMLEDVATYLTLAPVVATLVVGAAAAALWLAGRRPEPARIRIRVRDRR
jgi:hypothetical protein